MLLSRNRVYINTLFTPTFIRKRLYKWRNLLLISTAYTLQYLLKFLAFTIQNKRIIYCCVNNRIKIKLITKVCSTSLW